MLIFPSPHILARALQNVAQQLLNKTSKLQVVFVENIHQDSSRLLLCSLTNVLAVARRRKVSFEEHKSTII